MRRNIVRTGLSGCRVLRALSPITTGTTPTHVFKQRPIASFRCHLRALPDVTRLAEGLRPAGDLVGPHPCRDGRGFGTTQLGTDEQQGTEASRGYPTPGHGGVVDEGSPERLAPE